LLEVDRFMARRLADVVVAPSPEMGETFVNVYRCDPHTVKVIEHGLDLTRFDPARADPAAVRTELGLDGKLVLGAISKHFWVKNLDALVRAFATLAVDRTDLHLVVLGIGDRTNLATLVEELGLSSRVTVLAPRDDVPDVLGAFDLFIHPALAESFGFATVEAMAMARPVVSTPVGIAREVIEDEVSGFAISGTDPDSIRAAIERALARRDRWPQVGAEARRRALAFTAERWVSNHERLYETWLQRSRRRLT
jgi:glycosyltransferase involved in cell wall biosynthesis